MTDPNLFGEPTNPPPRPSTGDVWREVIDGPGRCLPADLRAAMEARRSLGIARYRFPVQRGNGRDHRLDAVEEALDLVAYLHAGNAPVLLRWGALVLLWAVWRWG